MSNRRKRRTLPIDRAMVLDRRYFQEHPQAASYVRAAIIGEAPADVRGLLVEVEQVRPGFRMRHFFRPEQGDGGKAIHDLLHQLQDALIEQNARRIRELEAERDRLKAQAA